MHDCLPSTTEIRIRNEIAELARVSGAMDRIGAEHGLAAKPLAELQVALDEVVSNVMKYGWPQGGSHEIRVRITVGDGLVTLEITDDGRPFDPLGAASPEPAPPGRRPRPGGLGIHMVRQFMDGIEYASVDGGNRLTLTKRCDVRA